MATYEYDTLKTKYKGFYNPKFVIKVDGKELTKDEALVSGDVSIDLTCGYEASTAEFSIYDAYDLAQNEYLFSKVKKFILLGSKVEIEMGYAKETTRVFLGLITRVNFQYEKTGVPVVRVTAMDVKGVMMAGTYEKQLTATTYSDAVSEILKKTAYDRLKTAGIISKITVQSTPDKTSAASAATSALSNLTGGLSDNLTSGEVGDALSDVASEVTGGADSSSSAAVDTVTDAASSAASSALSEASSAISSGLSDMLGTDINIDIDTDAVVDAVADKAKEELSSKATSALNDLTGGLAGSFLNSITEETTSAAMEMSAESDYDFVVKAGKRNNFEFFTECGEVIFREAKSDKTILMKIDPTMGLRSFDVSYDLTGMVKKVVVRGMDVSKGKIIESTKKLSNKISLGSDAKSYIKGSEKVYIDSTISSKEDADARAASLAEQISYRLGSLNCELTGIPELLPGHFIELFGLGTEPDNTFYLTRVRHEFRTDGDYETTLEGVAASVDGSHMTSNSIVSQAKQAISAAETLANVASDLQAVSDTISSTADTVTNTVSSVSNTVSQVQETVSTVTSVL